MAFQDLDEFLTVAPKVLPIRGKDYAFPGTVSADLWLRLQRIDHRVQQARDPNEEAVSDADEIDMMKELLGDTRDEMAADGLTSAHIKIVYWTLFAWHVYGEEVAKVVWDNQGELSAPNRATRRASSAKSARSRGSRAGSTAPKAKAAMAAPGRKSSSTGT